MEAQELLNVIDIIRNEKLYTERLAELKKVQEGIKADKYVSVTMEQADRVRNEYFELKEQAEENLKCLEEEVESRLKDERQKLKDAQQALNDERSKLDKWATKLEEEQKSLFKLMQSNKQHAENLRKRGDEISQIQKQCSEERNSLSRKVEQITKIFRTV